MSDTYRGQTPATRAKLNFEGKATFARFMRSLLIGIGLFLYTWLFAEGFITLVHPQPLMPRYVTGTAWGVRGNIPNARYWHRTPEVEVEYRMNGQGMRADREYPVAKPPGVCRVAVFGDSFFLGYELNLEDTFAYRLEKQLNQEGMHIEVLNFSVGGFGTAEMINTYEGFGRQFDPDMVIFEWHDGSDMDDNVRSGLFKISNGVLQRNSPTYLPAVGVQDALMKWAAYRFVADNSQVYTLLRDRVAPLVKRVLVLAQSPAAGRKGDAVSGVDSAGDVSAPRSRSDGYPSLLSRLLLNYANDTVAADGHAFLVVEVPRAGESPLGLIPARTQDRLMIVRTADRFHSTERSGIKLFYERGAGHINPRGVEVLLKSVQEPIKNSRYLEACRTHAS